MGEIEFPKLARVAIYFRTEKEENSRPQIEITRKDIEKYYRNDNWASVKCYRDLKKSTNEERPAYNRLIKDIYEGNVNYLIIVGGFYTLTANQKLMAKIEQDIKTTIVFTDLETVKSVEMTCTKFLQQMLSGKNSKPHKGGFDYENQSTNYHYVFHK